MTDVIVIGSEHHNTLGVVRSLGERGLFPIVISVTDLCKSFVRKSKYVSDFFAVDSPEDIIQCLMCNCVDGNEKKVVIACYDEVFRVLDQNSDVLINKFIIPGSPVKGCISEMMNKQSMTEFAMSLGFDVPFSVIVDSKSILDIVNYPCITKPLLSTPDSKSMINICQSENDLRVVLNSSPYISYQVQEYVEKDFEYQIIGCSTSKGLVLPGYSTILRPCKGSNTSFLRFEGLRPEMNNIVEKCKSFIGELQYKGLFSMEFIRGKDGHDYFLETNFRNDGNTICVLESGTNLPYIWYLDCKQIDFSNEVADAGIVYVMPEFSETKLFLTRQISLRDYISDLRRTNRFMDYDKNDTKPFWQELFVKLHLV